MSKLKVAILEDSKQLLKDLKENLEGTELVEVVAYATTSDEFFEKCSTVKPEALLLDIDLGGDSMNGLDIANKFKLPVLFVSGKTKDFYQGIEDLNINSEISVEHISKPITLEKLKKILPKFINEINAMSKAKYIQLDFADSKRNKIAVDSIVCLCTDKANGAESNNKQIFFTDRKSEILIDFSFSKMEEKGFSKNIFIQIHKSYRVNADKIIRYTDNHEVELAVFKSTGKTEFKKLSVSENFQKDVKRFRK
jgi:DNA-binding LytR/AlgR family response regulator